MDIKGIGTDITDRSRFGINNQDFNKRFLSDRELAILESTKGGDSLDFLSGRWAAKESIIKASNKEIKLEEIEVLRSESGAPIVYINGAITENIHISISHEKSFTVAFCVIEKV